MRFALALGLISVAAAARAGEPEAVGRFKKTLDAEAKLVLRVAHPLAKFKQGQCGECKKTDKGYELAYTIDWTGKGDKEQSTPLVFAFTLKDGAIDELTIATTDKGAFKGANTPVVLLRTQVKKRLRDFYDDKELIDKVDKLDADALLALWLKHADRKAKPQAP